MQPALERVGSDWERGALPVAQEHVASGITERALASIYPTLIDGTPKNGIRVLLAGVAGEQHSIGLRAISDVLDGEGFETIYLGPDTPVGSIVDAVDRFRPALVGLSLSLGADAEELERAVAAVAGTHLPVSVMLGGRGVPEELRGYPGYVSGRGVRGRDRPSARHGSPCGADGAGRGRGPQRSKMTSPAPLDRHAAATTTDLANLAREHARRASDYRAMALSDAVTGLPNRRAWDERLATMSAHVRGPRPRSRRLQVRQRPRRPSRRATPSSNRASTAVRDALRGDDFAARLGGDEFGVLLPHTDRRTAATIADRTRESIARALHREGCHRERRGGGVRDEPTRDDAGRRSGPLPRQGGGREPRRNVGLSAAAQRPRPGSLSRAGRRSQTGNGSGVRSPGT